MAKKGQILLSIDERQERDRRITEYAWQHLEQSYRQLGKMFNLHPMSIYFIVNREKKRPVLGDRYCDHCGHKISGGAALPTNTQRDSAVFEATE